MCNSNIFSGPHALTDQSKETWKQCLKKDDLAESSVLKLFLYGLPRRHLQCLRGLCVVGFSFVHQGQLIKLLDVKQRLRDIH